MKVYGLEDMGMKFKQNTRTFRLGAKISVSTSLGDE
jgi:hypothetical protein